MSHNEDRAWLTLERLYKASAPMIQIATNPQYPQADSRLGYAYKQELEAARNEARAALEETYEDWRIEMTSENYRFTGPNVAGSCSVEYDRERECWVATMDTGHVGTADSKDGAALVCFEAWLTNRHAYYQQPPEYGGEKR
jgi:hypothetical protein